MSPIPTVHKTTRQSERQARPLRLLPVLAAILAMAPSAWGATDLSNQPLATLPSLTKPNLLFVMDSSGSMGSAYMPDDMFDSSKYGFWSAQCNGVAYDPTITYVPPVDSTGAVYPNASLSNTLSDGYDSGSSASNIFTGGPNTYFTYKGSQPKMGWKYTTSGHVANTFFNECMTAWSSASSVFTAVTVSGTSAEAQNYANWYSYYRKRYLLMRTAMGRAIAALDSNYRVGFSTIYDTQAKDGTTSFVDVNDFDAGQKSKFYTSLYTVMPSGGTNLPDALSEAGRYFAHQISGQTADPVQYACQRNFTLLSTDGYWNSNSKDFALDGSTRVGEQDAAEVPPMKDAGTVSQSTTVTKITQALTGTYSSGVQTRTLKWTRSSATSVAGSNKTGSNKMPNCDKKGWFKVTTTTATATETQKRYLSVAENGTSTKTETVVKDSGGNVTSDNTTAPVTVWKRPTITNSTYTYTSDTSTSTPAADGTPVDPGTYSGTTSTTTCENSDLAAAASDSWAVSSDWTASTFTDTLLTTGPWVTGVPITTYTASGGSSDTLSDVAEYYYKSPLRSSALGNCTSASGTSADLCANIVPVVPGDDETWQHMNTYTIGLGTSGTLTNDADTLGKLTGTPATKTTAAVAPTLSWPTPNPSGDATNIDDLWHAALDGRGQYYSALSASQLSAAIADVVYQVKKVPGSGTAASTSSLELVAGNNNQIYRASYTTGAWTGDLQAYTLSGDATISATPTWSAQTLLDAVADPTTRSIYFSNGSSLQPFTYTALTTASKNSYFDNFCSKTPKPTQCAGLNAADLGVANSGANLVKYLIGGRTYETAGVAISGGTTASIIYRKREHVLGDIVDGAPVYVGKPPFSYADAGYADFVAAQKTRKPVVYVAANDGMLHAFSGDSTDGGSELWAYVPSFVMSNLYKLADSNYAAQHQYFVDGAPVMADIKVGGSWKTILVGGLNDGGQGYYALDITSPSSPKLLWEFTDSHMGYTFGNPVITKRADGTWVVAFTSGYNNSDGQGHLYVVDANSGSKLLDINTGAGTSSAPSGLSKINAWIENATDNTATRFYGGDLLGNLWRFDVDNLVLPHQSAMKLAQLQIDSSTPQPITTRPETAAVGTRAIVMVGTGQYLGSSDKAVQTQQSVYAIADNLTDTGWGDVRNGSLKGAFVKQTLTIDSADATATISNNSVNFADLSVGGWWVDLPDTGTHLGERVATNMSLQFNTLAVSTAIPIDQACTSGGSSWRYYLNVTNGGVVTTGVPAGVLWSSTSLIVGMSWVKTSDGNVRVIYQSSDGKIQTDVPPTGTSGGSNPPQPTSWRELTN